MLTLVQDFYYYYYYYIFFYFFFQYIMGKMTFLNSSLIFDPDPLYRHLESDGLHFMILYYLKQWLCCISWSWHCESADLEAVQCERLVCLNFVVGLSWFQRFPPPNKMCSCQVAVLKSSTCSSIMNRLWADISLQLKYRPRGGEVRSWSAGRLVTGGDHINKEEIIYF